MSESSYGFNPEIQNKAKNYLYNKLRISICKSLVLLVLGVIVLSLRISNALENSIQSVISNGSLIVLVYVLVGYGAFWLVSLPFDFYDGSVVEHKFELSTESRRGWLWDNVKASILSLFLVLLFAEGVYNFMWLNLSYWWFYIWLVSAFFIVIFMYVAPVLIMPLFYKFPRLENQDLLSSLTKLADKAGIKVIGVFEMKSGAKTKKATAALTGVGKTRRMLLSDTFLSNFSKEETESVMGHEIGHHVYGHIWKMTALLVGILLLLLFIANQVLQSTSGFFGIQHIDSVASLPLLALTLGLLFACLVPLINTLSRHAEGQCDQYELDLVEKPDAYISAMTKLCDQNLRYAYPPPIIEYLFYDHPSGKKRIQRALAYKETHPPN
ncbi:MAG TPA: M48 family metalloprotease [Candidatus Acidoferrum sp.]|nr:M48 family metalloprotease [Candidatus Acidoferrum sp.]